MTNLKVAEAFARGESAKAGHFRTDGCYAWSFNTIIAWRDSKGYSLDIRGYSYITGRHQNLIRKALREAGKEYLERGHAFFDKGDEG